MPELNALTPSNINAIQSAFDRIKGKRKEVPLEEILKDRTAAKILKEAGVTEQDIRALAHSDGNGNTISSKDFTHARRIFGGQKELSFILVAVIHSVDPPTVSNFSLVLGAHVDGNTTLDPSVIAANRTLPEELDGEKYVEVQPLSVFNVSPKGLKLLQQYEQRTPGNAFEKIRVALINQIKRRFGEDCSNCGKIFELDENDIRAIIREATGAQFSI